MILYIVSTIDKATMEPELEELPLSLKVKPQITSYVESCLQEIAIPGIYLLGIQGGVIYPENPDKVLLTEERIINFAYLNGVDQLSVQYMEKQLDTYIEQNINFCLDEYQYFTERGWRFESNKLQSRSKIAPTWVFLDLDYELKVLVGDDEITIESFSSKVPLRVGEVVEEAKRIVDTRNDNALVRPSQPSFFNSFFPLDQFTSLYSISDSESQIDNAPFTFFFAIRDININTPPKLEYIPNMVLRKDSSFTYQLVATDADDDKLSFSVEPAIFDIDQFGRIDQVLLETETYNLVFTVNDEHGLSDSQEMRLIVNE
tara:strand:- start:225 stop:1172 length:948 start_codon:yes stop_codon:yes gene_type:complete